MSATSSQRVRPWEHLALGAGVAVPFLYFGTQLVIGLATPGYSFARQAASELGATGASHAVWFNIGAVLTGAAAIAAAVGIASAGVRTRGRRVIAGLTALAVGSTGLAAVAAGMFPLPDPRHGGGPAGAGMFVLPVLAAVLLWPSTESQGLRRYLVGNLALFVATAVMISGATTVDLGSWHGAVQRLLAVTVFVPIAVIAASLEFRAGRTGTVIEVDRCARP